MEGAYWFWLEGGWHVSGRCILVLVGRWMACKWKVHIGFGWKVDGM